MLLLNGKNSRHRRTGPVRGLGQVAEHDQAFGRRPSLGGRQEPFCGVLKALCGLWFLL